MKKILVILLFIIANLAFGQVYTVPKDSITDWRSKATTRNATLAEYENALIYKNIQGNSSTSSATLTAIKKGIDTIAQNTRFVDDIYKMTKTTAQIFGSAIYPVSAGTVSGVRSISFIPSATMTGSINGIPVDGTFYKPLDVITISATPPAGVLNNISYTILTGSVLVNYTQ